MSGVVLSRHFFSSLYISSLSFAQGFGGVHFDSSVERLSPPPRSTEIDDRVRPVGQGRVEQISSYSSVVWEDCEEIAPVMKRKYQ